MLIVGPARTLAASLLTIAQVPSVAELPMSVVFLLISEPNQSELHREHPSTAVVPTWVGTPSAQDVLLFLEHGQERQDTLSGAHER